MVHKIHKIALVTDDIEETVRFYTQTLGLTVMERFPNGDGEDYVFLDAGGIILELMPQGPLSVFITYRSKSITWMRACSH